MVSETWKALSVPAKMAAPTLPPPTLWQGGKWTSWARWLHQLGDRFPIVKQIHRPAGEVGQRSFPGRCRAGDRASPARFAGCRECCGCGRVRPCGPVSPMTWPIFRPPPAIMDVAGRRPVVAAAVLVDLRRPAELAPDHHGHVLVQTAVVHVGEEGVDDLVVFGQLAAEVARRLVSLF